jgi:hypothetical protein
MAKDRAILVRREVLYLKFWRSGLYQVPIWVMHVCCSHQEQVCISVLQEANTISFTTNLTLHVSSSGVLRLVVIEPSTRFVEGVISLKDIFTFLLG